METQRLKREGQEIILSEKVLIKYPDIMSMDPVPALTPNHYHGSFQTLLIKGVTTRHSRFLSFSKCIALSSKHPLKGDNPILQTLFYFIYENIFSAFVLLFFYLDMLEY